MITTTQIDTAIADITAILPTMPEVEVAKLEELASLDDLLWLALGPKCTEFYMHDLMTLEAANRLHRIHTRFHTSAPLVERLVYVTVITGLVERHGL